MRCAQDQGTPCGQIWAYRRIATATTPYVWRRHFHLMLDAFRAECAHPLPVSALTEDEWPEWCST
jgi:hypothetical protein